MCGFGSILCSSNEFAPCVAANITVRFPYTLAHTHTHNYDAKHARTYCRKNTRALMNTRALVRRNRVKRVTSRRTTRVFGSQQNTRLNLRAKYKGKRAYDARQCNVMGMSDHDEPPQWTEVVPACVCIQFCIPGAHNDDALLSSFCCSLRAMVRVAGQVREEAK